MYTYYIIQDGYTALMYACKKGHIAIVQQLLSVPTIKVNLQDNVSEYICI